jgi:hypothetical protein
VSIKDLGARCGTEANGEDSDDSSSRRHAVTFDLQRILESKRAYRRRLASLPIGQKLQMLDALRERHLAIRRSSSPSKSTRDIARQEGAPDGEVPR